MPSIISQSIQKSLPMCYVSHELEFIAIPCNAYRSTLATSLIRYVKIQLNYSNNFVPFKHVPTLLEEPISRHSLVFACNFNVYKFRKLINLNVVVWKKSLYAIRPLIVGL